MKRSDLMPTRSRTRRGMSGTQKAVLGGAIALMAAPAIRVLATNLRSRFLARRSSAATPKEAAIDETLKETFPASDPPSSSYYDIPVNRQ